MAALAPARFQGPEKLERFTYTEYHMGVDVRMTVYAASKEQAETACTAAFEEFARLDSIMSDYRPKSELMQLCAKASGPPVKVSKDLFTVLERSQVVAKRSGGAFDITCGPEVALWRAARKNHSLPEPHEIARARALTGWRKLRLDARNRTAQLLVPGMKLDLGGIAKGYADDRAQAVLREHNITHALVEAGGDIVVSDPPPGTKGWQIELYTARNARGAGPVTMLFSNCAISTSGDTEQFVVIGGKRFSHIVDPRTGQALTDRIAVTIVAPTGMVSDSLSKVVSVLGEKAGKAVVRKDPGTRSYVRFLGNVDTIPTRPEPRTAPADRPPQYAGFPLPESEARRQIEHNRSAG